MKKPSSKKTTSSCPPPFVLVAVQELSRHASEDEARVEMAQYEVDERTTYYVVRTKKERA